MDKSWIQLPNRHWPEYRKGIDEFIEFASGKLDGLGRIRCPCNKCCNSVYKPIAEVRTDLVRDGIDKTYTCWMHHGEEFEVLTDDDDSSSGGEHMGGLQDMLDDLRPTSNMSNLGPDTEHGESRDTYVGDDVHSEEFHTSGGNTELFDRLLSEARQPLYPGFDKLSKLEFLVKLLHVKIINRWSNKSFDMVLQLFRATLPSGDQLPKYYYEVKVFMRNLGLGYISIHACKHDCVLFWKEHENLENCPKCGESRYKVNEGKKKKIPHKVLRYFPLKPRLQRLFMSRMTAADMRWHKEKRAEEENVVRHPADSKAWKEFDKDYAWFDSDSRNVRLGLASDGFNPFGDMSNAYSMWPVLLMPYNLPPWKCMKEPFFFMSLLIPGPKAPGNDIDVYLRPLIDELIDLWDNGVETYDAVTKQTFRLHAALLWTINDFPAYGNLSGWSTKGKMACPVCNRETSSMYLRNGRKLCYMNHFRFLQPRQKTRFRQLFGGNNRSRLPPKKLSGDDILSQLESLGEPDFGKASNSRKRKRTEVELNWTKKSIFFDLPYWRRIKLRHNLDVMHIEKNICESVLGTLMNLTGKTKDSVKTRMDLAELGIREELHLIDKGDKYLLPPACYTLSTQEKQIFCRWLKLVKFPDGYASNISRCVNDSDYKISGMKSHDCHVLLQRLLPVAMRGFLPNDVSIALIELGNFFRELCSKTLQLDILEKMEKDIAVILCKLEEIFPPSFFDVMIHLAVHLPHEAILAGPVQYRWMYPIERFLKTLKQYVRNKARPEGSIAEAYIDNECLTFCSMYLKGIETRFNREERNYDGGQEKQRTGLTVFAQNVRPLGASKTIRLDWKDWNKTHFYVLNNSEEIAKYLDEHMAELERESSQSVQERHEKYFAKWFEKRMQKLRLEKSSEATNDLYSLACGPDQCVNRYSGCIVNGIRFHTKDREKHLKTQNSGVVVKGVHQSKEIDFYGVLIDVIELEYLFGNRVFLFKCDWWDVGNKKTGIRTDGYFTSVSVSKTWYKDDQYVLSTQARQVFYTSDTKLKGDWHVVQRINPRNVYDVLETNEETGAKNDEAYQQEEQLGVDDTVEEIALVQLNRDDLEPEEVDVDVVRNTLERVLMEDTLISDDETEEEDHTLMEYNTENVDIILSDDDSDID